MDAQKRKRIRTTRRKHRVRRSIRGTATKPRLSVFRSHQHISAQLIDDENAVTLVAVSSGEKGAKLAYGGNIKAASEIGARLAEKAKAKGITAAAFDRGAYRYHGRVKALAEAATKAGLMCTTITAAKPKAEKPADEEKPAAKDKKEKTPAAKPQTAK